MAFNRRLPLKMLPAKQKTILDGNKILDVSELFRCYFDLYSMFFRCFISMSSLSMFCLFYVFAFRCFVVLFFVIDPLLECRSNLNTSTCMQYAVSFLTVK